MGKNKPVEDCPKCNGMGGWEENGVYVDCPACGGDGIKR